MDKQNLERFMLINWNILETNTLNTQNRTVRYAKSLKMNFWVLRCRKFTK